MNQVELIFHLNKQAISNKINVVGLTFECKGSNVLIARFEDDATDISDHPFKLSPSQIRTITKTKNHRVLMPIETALRYFDIRTKKMVCDEKTLRTDAGFYRRYEKEVEELYKLIKEFLDEEECHLQSKSYQPPSLAQSSTVPKSIEFSSGLLDFLKIHGVSRELLTSNVRLSSQIEKHPLLPLHEVNEDAIGYIKEEQDNMVISTNRDFNFVEKIPQSSNQFESQHFDQSKVSFLFLLPNC